MKGGIWRQRNKITDRAKSVFIIYRNGDYTTVYMAFSRDEEIMRLDVDELILFEKTKYVGDTYIFEPTKREENLGRLFVAAEAEERDGVGKELIDTIVQALQNEYYRDPSRGILSSFEAALHQVNLVLYDAVEQGVREWMGSFSMAVGVLSKKSLHVSTAGEGAVLLIRQSRMNEVSEGLSRLPIIDPLRTFNQVASGIVSTRDVLIFGSSQLRKLIRSADLPRLVADHAASAVTLKMKQLYQDRGMGTPLSMLVASVIPKYVQTERRPDKEESASSRSPVSPASKLKLRRPLRIHYSTFRYILRLLWISLAWLWSKLVTIAWPYMKRGSREGGRMIYKASLFAGENMKSLTQKNIYRRRQKKGVSSYDNVDGFAPARSLKSSSDLKTAQKPIKKFSSLPKKIGRGIIKTIKGMPSSSRWFAVLALVLAVALSTSLLLLQKKRTEDIAFEKASELLHEARTKKEAADTALIYDNRDHASKLIAEAEGIIKDLRNTGLYEEQRQKLKADVTALQDRLNQVMRLSAGSIDVVGDFGEVISKGYPSRIYYLNGELYSFDPDNNVIVKMGADGKASVANEITQDIGYFEGGAAHEDDKSLILLTDTPGIVVFDTLTGLLQKQEITFPSGEPDIKGLSIYGNRLYLYDRSALNIYGYSKTLRGYSGGNPWIINSDFPVDSITDIGVDGYIYTMHSNGNINKLLKGEPVDFGLAQVEPLLSTVARIYINEDINHIYVFDPPLKRVIIFDTVGNLNRQIYLGEEISPVDIAIDPSEENIYVLDGTRVVKIPLAEVTSN